MEEDILRQFTYKRKLFLLHIILAVLSFVVLLPILGSEEEIYFVEKFMRENFGPLVVLARLIYYTGVLIMVYSIMVVLFSYTYITTHINIQLVLLTELLKRIFWDHTPDINNSSYQETIHKRLKLYVKLHNRVKK